MNVHSNQSNEIQINAKIHRLEVEKQVLEEKINSLQHMLFESSLPIIELNHELFITNVNEAACRVLQKNKNELIGRSFLHFVHDQEKNSRRKMFSDQELLINGPDGAVKNITMKKIAENNRTTLYMMEDKSSDDFPTLRNTLTSSILQDIFANFKDCFLLLSHTGKIIHANRVFCKLFGISREELEGLSFTAFFPEEKREEYVQLWRKIEAGNQFVGSLLLKKGPMKRLFEASAHYNALDRIFVLFLHDVTEKRNMYQMINWTLKNIHNIFENMVDGTILWSKKDIPLHVVQCFEQIFKGKPVYDQHDLKIFLINKAGKKILNLNPEKPLSQQLDRLKIYDKNDEVFLPNFLKQRTKNQSDIQVVQLQKEEDRTLGIEFYTLPNIMEGMHLTIFRDITDRLAMEDNLRQSEMLHVLGELAAGVAHEIRNPMTSLKGFIQLLQASVDGYTMYFNIILEELERIESIVNEFLVLAKPQAVQYKYYNVVKIMQDTIDLLSAQAALENVRIHTYYPNKPINIFCKPNQIKQVFINIVKNAIEVMSGGGNITIRISHESASPYVKVSIRDQGEGIPKERMEKLGQPFYTSKERGTGLGLMVSYKIVKEHGGKIEVKSKVGRGTIFHIYLPVKQSEDESPVQK